MDKFLTKEPINISLNRKLRYLRLSLTDRCNLRCAYCMPISGVPKISQKEVLSLEENIKLMQIANELGFNKLRLTGGEPLLRKDIIYFIETVFNNGYFKDIRMTTNAILLEPFAKDLKQAGLTAINISLDALNPHVFSQITHSSPSVFNQAWRGLMKALEMDFKQIKINCVPLKGLNDDELVPLAELSFKYPITVRFIEHMPIGNGQLWSSKSFYQTAELKKQLEKTFGSLKPVAQTLENAGPARLFQAENALGYIGFISPMSEHFCSSCNRMRITTDGRLKPCLMSKDEFNLKKALKDNLPDEAIKAIFKQAAIKKPDNHFNLNENKSDISRTMNAIGG